MSDDNILTIMPSKAPRKETNIANIVGIKNIGVFICLLIEPFKKNIITNII
jgi:hypothetical protein